MKTERIEFRVSKEDKKIIEELAISYKITISELIISSVLERRFSSEVILINELLKDYSNQLSSIGNNINQIAKVVNTDRSISDEKIERFFEIFNENKMIFSEIKNEMIKMTKKIN